VERAYRIALETIAQGKPVFMLGNLVHNTQVVEKFKAAGTATVKELSEIPNATNGILLISAHGVPPEVYDRAKTKDLKIVDTTCSWVKKAQRIARQFAQEGRRIIIIGDKDHPEVKGLVGWSGGQGKVIEDIRNIGDIRDLAAEDKIGVLAQTTQTKERFWEIVEALRKKFVNIKAEDTICGATSKRQAAAVAVAKKVDLMLVIGDKMSANTKRLTELCAQTGVETHQIQTAAELNPAWLPGKKKLGLTAGASTPEWVIQDVIKCLS
jgi:4-hydroxy-3-methylbut-2-enyl diphosphate reductase